MPERTNNPIAANCRVVPGEKPVLDQDGQRYYLVAVQTIGDRKIHYWKCEAWDEHACLAVTRTTVVGDKHVELYDGTPGTMKTHNHLPDNVTADMFGTVELPVGNVYEPEQPFYV